MSVRIFSFFLGILLLAACKNPTDKKSESPLPADSSRADTVPQVMVPETKDLSAIIDTSSGKGDNDSVIHLNATGKLNTLTADIKKDYQQVQVHVTVDGTKKLTAILNPAGKSRNVRFNQIELPDKKTDGPFGLQLDYATGKNGIYTLIIGRNNMAEGTVRGPVAIQITLK